MAINFSRIIIYSSIVLVTVGCTAQLSFDDLTQSLPENTLVKPYTSDELNLNISLPKEFKLVENDYTDSTGYELFVDTLIDFEDGTNILSIYRYHSKESTLKGAWQNLTKSRQLIEDFRIYSEGLTEYLSLPAYYEHSACTISNKNIESITFLYRGNSSNYLMTVQANTEEGYPDNLKKLLCSAKSMKLLP